MPITCPNCKTTFNLTSSTAVLRRQIMELHERGLSCRAIAKLVDKGKTTVFFHIKKAQREIKI